MHWTFFVSCPFLLRDMSSTELFTSSPISGIDLFDYPILYQLYDSAYENRLPIGKQVEEHLLTALGDDERYTVLAHGLQIQHEGITLGELDFIIKDHLENVVFHLELVHKFYIYDTAEGEQELDRWIGPNYRDKLVYKLEKLESHQFPLLHHPATRPYLNRLGLDPLTMQQKLCFNAELYVPVDTVSNQSGVLAQSAIRGTYFSFQEFKNSIDPSYRYHVCTKQEWVQDEASCGQWANAQDCIGDLEKRAKDGRAVMVWAKQANKCERLFILF